MIIEASIFLILILPFPMAIRKHVINLFANTGIAQKFFKIQIYLIFLVLVFFVESIRRNYEITGVRDELKEVNEENIEKTGDLPHQEKLTMLQDYKVRTQLFIFQRNIYLTGFTLFLSFLLNRYINLLQKMVKTGEEVKKLKAEKKNK